MSKKRSPRSAATETRTKEKFYQNHYISEFTDSQAEKIWNRDFNLILIGAIAVLIFCIVGVI